MPDTRLLIVGGSDAGMAAALGAREVDPDAEVTVVVADAYPNYSICGLPFFLSGETPDWRDPAHRTRADIEEHGVRLLLDHHADHIDVDRWVPPRTSRAAPPGRTPSAAAACSPARWALRSSRSSTSPSPAPGSAMAEARTAGFDPLTTETVVDDHKAYYPGATRLRVRVTGDRRTGRLLGAQILGAARAQVAKRVDVYAAALSTRMTVDDVTDLDLSYTPPLSAPWDPVQAAATDWTRATRPAEPAASRSTSAG